MFAALDTVEPPIFERAVAAIVEHEEPWFEHRQNVLAGNIRKRLDDLSNHLGDSDWLDGAFSAGDLLMVHVLLRLKGSDMLDEYPNLSAYVVRGEARPAFKRAFEAQLAAFAGKPPAGE